MRRTLGCGPDEETLYERAMRGMSNGRRLLLDAMAAHPTGLVVLLDLDDLRTVNRRFGVRTGDRLMAKIDRSLQVVAAGHGGAARHFGGDRYLVVVPGAAEAVLPELLKAVRRQSVLLARVSASAGDARWSPASANPPDVLSAAAGELHLAKQSAHLAIHHRRASGAMVVAAALGLGSCTSSPSPESTSIVWGDCAAVTDVRAANLPAEKFGRLEFSCGALDVDLDPAHKEAGTIAVQLIRIHQSGGQATKDPLLLIAGGPGQSGVDYASIAAGLLPDAILDRFDLVGFDPRGVGHSHPIRCEHTDSGPPRFPDLLTAAGYAKAAAEMRKATDGCAAALGSKAALFNTTATAADIDQIRSALGQPALTYLGWSYGAKLGAEYARLYPDKVRAAVLDAPSNPGTTWIETAERQVAGFEHSFDQFTAWCATQDRCARFGNVRTFVGDLVRKAEKSPIGSGRPGDDVPTYGMDVLDAVVTALYDDARWPDLADGLAEAADGDSGTLRELADAGRGGDKDSNAGDAQLVINCNDSAPGPTEAEIKAAGSRFAKQYPLFGVWGSWHLFGCAFWQPPRHTLRPPVAATAHPIMVVGTRHDPATPYSGAVAMATSLGTAELLTWEGQGHGAVGRNDCITRRVADYLVSLKVPPRDTRCPA
jgi:pimeloyl-ACP methyl ester carboxylesterase/GGDEF domain-containing protein